MKEKFRFSVSALEIPKLQFSVALLLTLSNLHYKCCHIFCPWKASGINCVCDLSVISNLLSIISSPRGLDYTNPVWKPEKNPCFYFSCLIQVIHKSHFRAKHLSLISGSLVFQFLCTSPEALLNLEIIVVIIIYSLCIVLCHNTLDSPAPFLLGTIQEKHERTSTPKDRKPQCDVATSRYTGMLISFHILHIMQTLRTLWKRVKCRVMIEYKLLSRYKVVFFFPVQCLWNFTLIWLTSFFKWNVEVFSDFFTDWCIK